MANLFKTFINAAVAQVGRDGGRVISNKIYGNGYAMPVRIAGKDAIQTDEGKEIGVYKSSESFFNSPWWLYLFMAIGSFVLFPISWIYFMLGFLKYRSKTTTDVVVRHKEAVHKQDLRYRSGSKIVGYRYIDEKIPTPATAQEINMYKNKSWVYFGLFCLYLGFGIWVFFIK